MNLNMFVKYVQSEKMSAVEMRIVLAQKKNVTMSISETFSSRVIAVTLDYTKS